MTLLNARIQVPLPYVQPGAKVEKAEFRLRLKWAAEKLLAVLSGAHKRTDSTHPLLDYSTSW